MLFRGFIMKKNGLTVVLRWQIFPGGCSMIFEGLPNAPSTAHGARLRAALLRRSCDGVDAATEMRRPAPSRSFCASRPRRSRCC